MRPGTLKIAALAIKLAAAQAIKSAASPVKAPWVGAQPTPGSPGQPGRYQHQIDYIQGQLPRLQQQLAQARTPQERQKYQNYLNNAQRRMRELGNLQASPAPTSPMGALNAQRAQYLANNPQLYRPHGPSAVPGVYETVKAQRPDLLPKAPAPTAVAQSTPSAQVPQQGPGQWSHRSALKRPLGPTGPVAGPMSAASAQRPTPRQVLNDTASWVQANPHRAVMHEVIDSPVTRQLDAQQKAYDKQRVQQIARRMGRASAAVAAAAERGKYWPYTDVQPPSTIPSSTPSPASPATLAQAGAVAQRVPQAPEEEAPDWEPFDEPPAWDPRGQAPLVRPPFGFRRPQFQRPIWIVLPNGQFKAASFRKKVALAAAAYLLGKRE